jgi:hypothetical protein
MGGGVSDYSSADSREILVFATDVERARELLPKED